MIYYAIAAMSLLAMFVLGIAIGRWSAKKAHEKKLDNILWSQEQQIANRMAGGWRWSYHMGGMLSGWLMVPPLPQPPVPRPAIEAEVD